MEDATIPQSGSHCIFTALWISNSSSSLYIDIITPIIVAVQHVGEGGHGCRFLCLVARSSIFLLTWFVHAVILWSSDAASYLYHTYIRCAFLFGRDFGGPCDGKYFTTGLLWIMVEYCKRVRPSHRHLFLVCKSVTITRKFPRSLVSGKSFGIR